MRLDCITVVDVGASVGLLSAHMARLPGVRVFASEPLPDVAARIPRMDNLKVLELGVRDVPEPRREKLIRTANSELSSFSPLNALVDKHLWAYHLPFATETERVDVTTVSLAWILQEELITDVSFLKIDAQGLDLEVLRSCGGYLHSIQSICIEIPYVSSSALYANETGAATAIAEVAALGFTPMRLVPNGAGEANLFAANSKLTIDQYFQLEDRLAFHTAPTLKIGNHRRPLSSRLRSGVRKLADQTRRAPRRTD